MKTLINAETYPLLHKGRMMIRQDNGAVNRYENEQEFFTREPVETLMIAEAQLAALSDEDFETFCIGSAADQDELLGDGTLSEADYLFTEWFSQL